MTIRESPMFNRSVATALVAVSFTVGAAMPGMAKGCLKGAAVGGVAGHVAGHHGVIGAAAGCAVGHHQAAKKAKTDNANPPS